MSDDRKYRHRGYMDSSDQPRRRTPGTTPEGEQPRIDGAPRGRGADQDKSPVFSCKKCSEEITRLEEVRDTDSCPKCGADLHACVQCGSFDGASRFECLQHMKLGERIADKNHRNKCRFFEPSRSFNMTGIKPTGTASDARKAFEALFRK